MASLDFAENACRLPCYTLQSLLVLTAPCMHGCSAYASPFPDAPFPFLLFAGQKTNEGFDCYVGRMTGP